MIGADRTVGFSTERGHDSRQGAERSVDLARAFGFGEAELDVAFKAVHAKISAPSPHEGPDLAKVPVAQEEAEASPGAPFLCGL